MACCCCVFLWRRAAVSNLTGAAPSLFVISTFKNGASAGLAGLVRGSRVFAAQHWAGQQAFPLRTQPSTRRIARFQHMQPAWKLRDFVWLAICGACLLLLCSCGCLERCNVRAQQCALWVRGTLFFFSSVTYQNCKRTDSLQGSF